MIQFTLCIENYAYGNAYVLYILGYLTCHLNAEQVHFY